MPGLLDDLDRLSQLIHANNLSYPTRITRPTDVTPTGAMPSTRQFSVSLLVTTFVVFTLYVFSYQPQHARLLASLSPLPLPSINSNNNGDMTVAHDNDILADLAVSLEQTTKTSPPTLAIRVTNNSTRTLTILTWESPLDPLALQLGLLRLGAGSEADPTIEVPTVKVSRKMPPGEDSLVTLAPGESRANLVVLKERSVPVERLRGRRTQVALSGAARWSRVWTKARAALTESQIAELGVDGTAVSGDVKGVESIRIEVD